MIVDQPQIHFVSKGWGFEKWIINTEKYCGKLLYLVKGKKCSLHFHKQKDETFYVHSGKVVIYFSNSVDEIKNTVKSVKQDELASILYDHDKRFSIEENDKFARLERVILKQGDNFYVPPMRVHQIVAIEDSELFEFSTQHFDADSFRIIKGD